MDTANNMIAHASFGVVLVTGWIVCGALIFGLTTLIAYAIRPPRPAHWLPPIGPGYRARYVPARTWRPILIRATIATVAVMFLLFPIFLLMSFAGVANNSRHQLSTAPRR